MTEDEVTAERVARRLEGKKKWKFTGSELVYYEFDCEAIDEDDAYKQWHEADLDQCIVDRREFKTEDVYCEDNDE